MSEPSVLRTNAAAIVFRMVAALVIYAVGILVLLLSADAPIRTICYVGLGVTGAVLGQWWSGLGTDIQGDNKLANLGLMLTTIGFLVAVVATVGDMDVAVTGSSFVVSAAGMCLGAVRS